MALPSPLPRSRTVLVVDSADPQPGFLVRCVEAFSPGVDIVRCPTPEDAWSALISGRPYVAVVTSSADAALRSAAGERGAQLIHPGDPGSARRLRTAVAGGAIGWEIEDRRGWLIVVCGTGCAGTSSLAAGLAALAAARPTSASRVLAVDRVLLADLALRADQAYLHGQGESAGGLVELVDIASCRPLTRGDIRRHTVPVGRCRLLPGLRHPSHWTALNPPAFDQALSSQLRIFDLVVADITADLEGEAESGSMDVEERNHPARCVIGAADVVVAVGRSGTGGRRRLGQLVDDLLDHGVDPARIQPVSTHLAGLPGPTPRHTQVSGLPATPVAVVVQPGRSDGPLSPPEVEPVLRALSQLLARLPRPDGEVCVPVPVRPGSLGCAAS